MCIHMFTNTYSVPLMHNARGALYLICYPQLLCWFTLVHIRSCVIQHLHYSIAVLMDDLRSDGQSKFFLKSDCLTQFYRQLNAELQFQLHVGIVSYQCLKHGPCMGPVLDINIYLCYMFCIAESNTPIQDWTQHPNCPLRPTQETLQHSVLHFPAFCFS